MVKRNPSCPALECVDKQDCGSRVDVSNPQPQSFSKAYARAIEDKQQRLVESGTKSRPFQIGTQRHELEDVVLGEEIRTEHGFSRQLRPARFDNRAVE